MTISLIPVNGLFYKQKDIQPFQEVLSFYFLHSTWSPPSRSKLLHYLCPQDFPSAFKHISETNTFV